MEDILACLELKVKSTNYKKPKINTVTAGKIRSDGNRKYYCGPRVAFDTSLGKCPLGSTWAGPFGNNKP